MPRSRIAHQSTQERLLYHFHMFENSFEERPYKVHADTMVALPPELPRMFSPGLAVILQGNDAVVGDRMIEGVLDIVVEVLSSDRNRDLVRKRQVYAEARIPEYWIVDEQNRKVMPLASGGWEYDERGVLTVDDTLTTPLLLGLKIPPAGIFRQRGHAQPRRR